MSHLLTGLIDCEAMQSELTDHFVACDPTKTNELTPLVQFLNSSVNTNNILRKEVAPGRTKIRTVNLTYTPRVRENEVSNSTAIKCVSTNKAGMLQESYEIDTTAGVSWDEAFNLADMARMCKDNSLWFASRIQDGMNGMIRHMETNLVSDLQALIGKFADDETNVVADVKTVTTKFSDGKPDTNMLEEVTFAAANAGYCTAPYVFGWGEAAKYMKRLQAGCCADSGLDLFEMLQMNGMIFMPSYRIEKKFATNHFITMAAGALQLLTYNEFEEDGLFNNPNYQTSHKRMIVTDPLTRLPFDMLINFPCAGDMTVQMKLAYKLVGMPDDLFSTGDRLRGVTQVNHFKIVNP